MALAAPRFQGDVAGRRAGRGADHRRRRRRARLLGLLRAPIAVAGSGFPNADQSNRREVGGQIDSASVAHLEVAWTHPATVVGSYGSYASTPVIVDGVVYSQDLASNVEAIDLGTGKVLWRKAYDAKDEGPNGVTVAGGRVYGATPTAAFALDQATGEQVWSTTLDTSPTAGIDMAPGYRDGIVYVSTVPTTARSQYTGPDVGVLWALDARTGRMLWSFRTIAAGARGGGSYGGGVWYPPAFDASGGMYLGVGNPTPFPAPSRLREDRAGPAPTSTATRSSSSTHASWC